jgi:hypothetical protein
MANFQLLLHYISTDRKLNEFIITETKLKLIAKAAIIGDKSKPKVGNKTPAAIGMPKVLYPNG